MHDARLRALFLNQGAIGTTVVGHLTVEAALKLGLRDVVEIDAGFARLPSWSAPARAFARPIPVLGPADLDGHVPRWHLVEALRGRHALDRLVPALRPEVLHLDSHVLALASAGHMHRIPTILSVDVPIWDWHAMGVQRPIRPWSRPLLWPSEVSERRALAAAALVVARSHWAAAAVRRIAPEAATVVLHPGIDVERYRPAPRRPRTTTKVLFVGARFAEKGGTDLIEALEPWLGRDISLDIVTLARVAPRAGISVHRLQRDDPRLLDLFQQADIFCLPSRGDSFGWAALEAMACGAAVVASPVGALPELLEHGKAGLLAATGDIPALRAAVRSLVDDSVLRDRLGRRARERVCAEFDVGVQGRRLAGMLQTVRDGEVVIEQHR